MGRNRKKDGVIFSVYISKELYQKLKKYNSVSRSDLVENALKFILNGHDEVLKLTRELEIKNDKLKVISDEKSRLEKENERLQKKIEKLEKENEELRAKWKGQTTLKKYEQKSMEIKAIAERISRYIEEGKTWREVAKEAGFILPGDQIDILKKVFQKEGYSFKSEFIPGWKLTEGNTTLGYFGYIFKKENEHGHAAPRVVEVPA